MARDDKVWITNRPPRGDRSEGFQFILIYFGQFRINLIGNNSISYWDLARMIAGGGPIFSYEPHCPHSVNIIPIVGPQCPYSVNVIPMIGPECPQSVNLKLIIEPQCPQSVNIIPTIGPQCA